MMVLLLLLLLLHDKQRASELHWSKIAQKQQKTNGIAALNSKQNRTCVKSKHLTMRHLILLTLIAVVSAGDQCAHGGAYWCSSIQNAKQCGAFQHCLTTVWKDQKLEQDASELCTYCENIVTDVKKFISSKQTQDQIKQFMDSACSIIPASSMATECKEMVDTYLPEVLTLIEAQLEPQMVCSLMGLCKGLNNNLGNINTLNNNQNVINNILINNNQNVLNMVNLPRVPFVKVPADQAEPVCTDCKKFMQDIKNQVTSPATEKQIEQLLEQNLCAMLGALKDECKALVESYVPELMQLLSQEFDPAQLCGAMGFCAANELTPRVMLAKMRLTKSPLYKSAQLMSNDADCDICKTMVQEVRTMIKDQKTQEEVEDFVKKNICALLGAMKGACDESVDEYGPELFALIVMEADPDEVCQALGMCKKVSPFNILQPVHIQPQMLGLKPLMQSPPKPQPPKSQPKPVKASATCVMCEFVMDKLVAMLKENATKGEIEQALDKICSLLPSSISAECKSFVDEYAPAIIEILSQEMNPQVVCTTLGLCSNPGELIHVANGEFCGVCETMMQYIDSMLTQNSTIQEIKDLLEKVCNFLPKSYATQCDDIVDEYGAAIITLISQFADPKEICTEIGLCTAKLVKEVPMEKIVASKTVLLGSNKCTYGPAYWCASHENAEKCKATAHCKKYVWKKKP